MTCGRCKKDKKGGLYKTWDESTQRYVEACSDCRDEMEA
jgi:hypothetical protein